MESNPVNPRRKILHQAVGILVQEVGFHDAEKVALETLTEMLQSCKHEIEGFSIGISQFLYYPLFFRYF